MNSRTDQQLLADYAERHAEAAFAELVRRHIDLVHSAALRMVRDSQLAEDVTQGAFIALAQNAKSLADRPVLSGWLHRTAQNLAANAVRSEVRRRAREQEAAAMNELLTATPDASWEQIAPHLDAALGELSEPDRDALLLRYFEKKSAQEMADVLGVSADAAQKRVNRAVERLRECFAKRGVTIGAGGLVVVISASAVQAAPAGLAATVSAAAALAGTITSAATTAAVTTSTAATKVIAMTTLQKTLVTATVAVLAGAGLYEFQQAARLRDQVQTIEQVRAPLAEQVQQLQRERDDARKQLAAMREDQKRAPDNTAELLRLRGMAGVARRAIAEAEQLRAQLAQQPAGAAASNPIAGAMADAMNQAMEQQAEGRLARMTASLHLTPEQVRAAREILTRQSRAMSAGMQQGMTGKFDKQELNRLAKEAGNTDEQIKALLTPAQQAAYPACQQEEAAHTAGLAANQELLQMQSTLSLAPEQLDRVYAALYEVSLNQFTGTAKPPTTNQRAPGDPVSAEADALQWAMDQKTKALEPLLTEAQLKNYREQLAAQAKLVKEIMNKLQGSDAPK